MAWVVPGTCYSGLTLSKRIVQEGEICLPGIPITRANISLMSKKAGEQKPKTRHPEALTASGRRLR